MQRKGKEETDRFMQAIAAFSAAPDEVTPRGRRLQHRNKGAMQAILSEIDETVLRRNLVFTTKSDAELVLDVGERRLLAIVSMPADLDALCSNLSGRPLQEADAAAARSLLAEFAGIENDIFVSSQVSEDSGAEAYGGLSAKFLMAQENMKTLNGVSDALIQAIEMSKPQCRALVVSRLGEALLQHGDTELCDSLEHQLTEAGSNNPLRRDVVLWHSGRGSVDCVMRAEANDVQIAMVGSYDLFEPLFATWRNAVME